MCPDVSIISLNCFSQSSSLLVNLTYRNSFMWRESHYSIVSNLTMWRQAWLPQMRLMASRGTATWRNVMQQPKVMFGQRVPAPRGNICKLGLFNQEDIRKPTKIFVAQCGFFTKYSFLLLPLRDAQFSQTGLCVGRVSTKLLRSVGWQDSGHFKASHLA